MHCRPVRRPAPEDSRRAVLLACSLLLSDALAQPAPPPEAPAVEWLVSSSVLNVRREPSATAPLRGRIGKGEPFEVRSRTDGPGCKGDWGLLGGDGYACLDSSTPSTEAPVQLPRLVAFDPPEPSEYFVYRDTGVYAQAPVAEAEALLPYIYGKRWRRWKGAVWRSVASYERGDAPSDELDPASKHAFKAAIDTSRGQVLLQEDGTVVPVDQVFLYPVSRFQGRDLVAAPLPADRLAAWAMRYDGARLRAAPTSDAEILRTVPQHQALEVEAVPATADGRWWVVPDALGPGLDAYADSELDIRRWVPAAPPSGLGPEELWVDVDRNQQVLALRQGEALLYVTMVSTGEGAEHETPRGIYRMTDVGTHGDMASRADAEPEDFYEVEKVPWVAHFWPRVALHGTFWHWGFGHKASHGCVNLAPRDAAWLFARLQPAIPPGWQVAYVDDAHPGTVIRVRLGEDPVPDRRAGQ